MSAAGKNGWTGDASLSCEQLLYNFDCADSLREWMNNIRKAQTKAGELPGIVPTDGWGYGNWSGPAWDSVLTEIPYQLYRFTGDKEIIRENVPAIMKYFDFLQTKRNGDGLIDFGLGDWCEAGTIREDLYRTPTEVTGTLTTVAILNRAKHLFSEIGDMGNAKQTQVFRNDLIGRFRNKYIKNESVTCNTQTAQAMAIGLGIFTDAEGKKAYRNLLKLIEADGSVFRVGIIGAKYLFDVLAEHGDAELAVALVRGPKYPSYGYWTTHGMTTLNEAFVEFVEDKYPDELIRKDGRGQLVSLNHHCWASISAWFYKYIAGLNILSPDKVVVRPKFVKSIDWAKANFENEEKSIFTEWKRDKEEIVLKIKTCNIGYDLQLPDGFSIKCEERKNSGIDLIVSNSGFKGSVFVGGRRVLSEGEFVYRIF